MAKKHNAKNARRARDELSVSHRERLVEELRADPKLVADYLNAAAEDGDARVHLRALRTVAGR
jgi:DNA-binding phage protein